MHSAHPSLKAFVQNVLDETLQPTIKSKLVLKKSECPLIDVVARHYPDLSDG